MVGFPIVCPRAIAVQAAVQSSASSAYLARTHLASEGNEEGPGDFCEDVSVLIDMSIDHS